MNQFLSSRNVSTINQYYKPPIDFIDRAKCGASHFHFECHFSVLIDLAQQSNKGLVPNSKQQFPDIQSHLLLNVSIYRRRVTQRRIRSHSGSKEINSLLKPDLEVCRYHLNGVYLFVSDFLAYLVQLTGSQSKLWFVSNVLELESSIDCKRYSLRKLAFADTSAPIWVDDCHWIREMRLISRKHESSPVLQFIRVLLMTQARPNEAMDAIFKGNAH